MNAEGFDFIEKIQGKKPWGRVLDAGTGTTSLEWLCGLQTESWTAVTGDANWVPDMTQNFADRMRDSDRIVAGSWTDDELLGEEVYDVVLADFLLGAIDRITPYFQGQLFSRLHRHVGTRLYVVGIEPHRDNTPSGRVIMDIERLRDAAHMLSRGRFHREYPRWWVMENLKKSGYEVESWIRFTLTYGERFINEELDVCRSAIQKIPDIGLAREMSRVEQALRRHAIATLTPLGLPAGEEYVIVAKPTGSTVPHEELSRTKRQGN